MSKIFQKFTFIVVCAFFGISASVCYGARVNWTGILHKYRADNTVTTVIFVQYIGGSDARVLLYKKDKDNSNAWTLLLQCDGYVGKNGISSNKHEGDGTTPSGDFGVIEALGIKKNPASNIPYCVITEDLYCSSEQDETYNTIVSRKDVKGELNNSEHLFDYSPQYNYLLFLDFNKECVYGKGSAIFFHCAGPNPYTAGCVAVSEENMKRILQLADKNVRVCIYEK